MEGHKKFILSLREFRPELAEFMQFCERGTVTQVQCDFALKRVHYLAGEGRTQQCEEVAKAAGELEYALHEKRKPAELALFTAKLLEAAMHALTFSGAGPAANQGLPRLKNGSKPVMVVADDDRIVREMMHKIFEPSAELFIAENGRQAHALIEQHRPHLVILDDFMPEMTGLKLIETLHASSEFSSIPVIMLTASDRERDIDRATQAGAVDYVLKPFDPAKLLEKVSFFLKNSKDYNL